MNQNTTKMNLLHLLIPHNSNNYRSKILHHASLLILISFFTLLTFFGIIINKTYPEVLGISYQISDKELLNLVNVEREKNGLEDLELNEKLSKAAQEKANNMFQSNYWAHFAPDGTTPWKFIVDQNYEYIYAGENLARGYTTSRDAVDAWMNSPTHKANILSAKYEDMGFGILEGRLQGEDTVLIVQMFGSTRPIEQIADTSKVISMPQAVTVPQPIYDSNTLGSQIKLNPIIDIVFGTKAIVFLVLSILTIALIIDFIIVEKNKIPRAVGNNLDHIIIITLFALFIFTAKIGEII